MTKDYPGLDNFLNAGRVSVQLKSNRPIQKATDQCGEQTTNLDTVG